VAKRTDGDWGVIVLPDGGGAMVVTPPPEELARRIREGDLPVTCRLVALCKSSAYVSHGKALANARLMAAAPDLYKALLGLLDGLDANDDPEVCGLSQEQWGRRVEAARTALTRAEGG
jgi:hypothetical protein